MLVKDFHRQFVPGTPGSPEVPARDEYTVCYPQQSGSWQYVCRRVELPGLNTGVQIPPGGELVLVYDPDGTIDPLTGRVKVIDAYIQVCASEWVPGPGADPICVTYPAVPHQPAVERVPSRWDVTPMVGWDAGANSVQVIDGDCELAWTMEMVVGAYVGLTEDREAVPATERIAHGFMFHQRAGVPHFRVVEYGEARSNDMPYSPGDEFVVRRARGRVTYLHVGEAIQSSPAGFDGPASAGCALYASGDFVPAGDGSGPPPPDPDDGFADFWLDKENGNGSAYGQVALYYTVFGAQSQYVCNGALYEALLTAESVRITGLAVMQNPPTNVNGAPDGWDTCEVPLEDGIVWTDVDHEMSLLEWADGNNAMYYWYNNEPEGSETWYNVRVDVDGQVFYGVVYIGDGV